MNKTSFPCVTHTADLCVVGGGMAGLCAAIAAARHGAKVVLMHDRPVLGGNASSEIRMWICGAHGADNKETGILEEIMLENQYRNPGLKYTLWDTILYDKVVSEPNLTLLLNCAACEVRKRGPQHLASVTGWQAPSQTWHTVKAKLFADCSGDSVLRVCGAEVRQGREARAEFGESHAPAEADLRTMGNSLLLQLREVDEHVPFIPPAWAHKYTETDLPNRHPYPQGCNFWWLEIGGMQDTIHDAEEIRHELYRIAFGVWDLIKNHPDGRGRNWELEWLGAVPGKRENVRYVGDHILTQNDVEAEGRFADLVAFGGWSMDDHHPEAIRYPGAPTIFHPAPSPYGIPFRCLYSRNIDNLLFAGRNISATHMALSSTRVMATCAILGQAVGTAAALAVRHGCLPRGVYEQHIAELQQALLDDDCYLPWHPRPMPELTRRAQLTASADDPEPLRSGIDRSLGAADNGWWGAPGQAWVEYRWDAPVRLTQARFTFDSNLRDVKRMPCNYPRKDWHVAVPGMLPRDFRLEVPDGAGGWRALCEVRNNHARLVRLPVAVETCALRFVPLAGWGAERVHVFGFDVA